MASRAINDANKTPQPMFPEHVLKMERRNASIQINSIRAFKAFHSG